MLKEGRGSYKMAFKEGDFIEIEYTGAIKESGIVFDTTSIDVAKKNNLYDTHKEYGPIIICLGHEQLLKGLDQQIRDKELNKDYKIEVKAENAFGKKSAQLIQMISSSKFKEQKVPVAHGMQVNIDGNIGIIKSISGGRIIVDFNHPLAGSDLVYNVKVNKKIDDDAQKIKAIFEVDLGIKDTSITLKDGIAAVDFKAKDKFPEEIKVMVKKKIKEMIPSLKDIIF